MDQMEVGRIMQHGPVGIMGGGSSLRVEETRKKEKGTGRGDAT